MRSRSEPSKFLPTPIAHDAVDGKTREQVEAMRARTGAGVSNLNEVVVHELFPTPTASDGPKHAGQGSAKRKAGGHAVRLSDVLEVDLAPKLFPTPRTTDSNGAGAHGDGGLDLRSAVSMLPTPTTRDGEGSGGSKPEHVTLTDAVVRTDMGTRANPRHVELLPTPAASLNGYDADVGAFEERRAAAAARHGNNGIGVPLGVAVRMLPTPRASRGASATETVYALGGERQNDERTQGQVVLDDVTDWGKYREAVERTEAVTGIPAPAPAIPDGKGGKMRLHDRFVEWMMLLTPGWVIGHGLTRQKALERLGNGVVPLQAAAATATNLTRLAEWKRSLERQEAA